MKREIKFRGIRRDNSEWIYGLPSYTSGGSIGRIVGFTENGDDSIGGYFEVEVIEKTVSEFTGLHDKNGKEIYEGDIINDGTKLDPLIMKIEFINASFCKCNENGNWIIHSYDKCEVIGNIYQNHELLNE